MTEGNVVPLFKSAQSKKQRTKDDTAEYFNPKGPFYRFPEGTRFELSKDGEVIISLSPDARAVVKKTWTIYLRSAMKSLTQKGIKCRAQGFGGDVDKPEIPDVLRVSLQFKS
jgi:hypothetical protein